MTKKILLAAAALVMGTGAFGQTGNVGIGTTTPASSAKLDIQGGGNKGMRPPQAALTSSTDVTTIPNPVRGLTVYNTNTQNDVEADHPYWWDGSKWIRAITTERPIGTTPPAKITWDSSSGASLTFSAVTSSQVQVLGPFTVPISGWYSCYIRTYFTFGLTAPSGAAPTDDNALGWVWYVITTDGSASTSQDVGQLFDTRFSTKFGNPSSSPFVYLTAGTNYYVKYSCSPITSGATGYISTEKKVILSQFK